MMFNYPYFGFPPYYRRFYPRNINVVPKQPIVYNNSKPNNAPQDKNTSSAIKLEEQNRDCSDKEDDKKNNEVDSPLFDLFGLKLYFDDVLLLGLLFVLYSEGVDDTNLYIALVLLLMS